LRFCLSVISIPPARMRLKYSESTYVVSIYLYLYVRMYVHMHVCFIVSTHLCTYVRMYVVCIYVRMFVCFTRKLLIGKWLA
jgi:hypothetical protein